MIQSHLGITHAPFTHEEQPLLEAQKEILENLRVHAHQRGFCIVAGAPGTGKSVLRQAFAQSGDRPAYIPTLPAPCTRTRTPCASSVRL